LVGSNGNIAGISEKHLRNGYTVDLLRFKEPCSFAIAYRGVRGKKLSMGCSARASRRSRGQSGGRSANLVRDRGRALLGASYFWSISISSASASTRAQLAAGKGDGDILEWIRTNPKRPRTAWRRTGDYVTDAGPCLLSFGRTTVLVGPLVRNQVISLI